MKRKNPDKYVFSPVKNIIIWLIVALFYLVLLEVLFPEHGKYYLSSLGGGCAIFIGMIYRGNTVYSLRYVEFHDSYIILNHFKVGRERLHFNIPYESIRMLKAVYIPIVGMYKVRIYADNMPGSVSVNSFITRHNEMFCRMYAKTIENNPDAEISKNLVRFAERRNKGN